MRGTQQPQSHRVIQIQKYGGDLTSDVLFCFPALRFDVFSPYRDGRYCSAPKPGEEKQKSYDYRSAIVIVHDFDPSFLCHPGNAQKPARGYAEDGCPA